MRKGFRGWAIGAVVAVVAVGSMLISRSVVMTQGAGQASTFARTVAGKPDFSGIWQANNEAHWDLQAHEALPGMVMQPGVYPYSYARVPAAPVVALGAAAGVPGSLGVVQGDGEIPYTPEAAKIKTENAENWIDRDPELKCYLPGIPRAMYMPYPLQMFQSTNKIPDGFHVYKWGSDRPPGSGRGTARRYVYGPFGRPLGRGHARRGRDGLQRQELVRQGGKFPQRSNCVWWSASRRSDGTPSVMK